MKHLDTLFDRLQNLFDQLAGAQSFYTFRAEAAVSPLVLPKDVELPAVWRRRCRHVAR